MRVGELCDQFNTDEAQNVLKQLRENKCPIKFNLIASREVHPQYFTFIGKDAIDALKEYLNVRGEVKEGEPIFISQRGEPIQGKVIDNQVQVLKRQTGLVNKDFTPHTLRDIFRTEASHQGVEKEIAEFFIGHALDQLGYNRLDEMYPTDFERAYAKIEPALNIVSFRPSLDQESYRKQLAFDDLQRRLNLSSETIEEIKKMIDSPDTTAEQINTIVTAFTNRERLEKWMKSPEREKTKVITNWAKRTEYNGGSQYESKIIDSNDEEQLLSLVSMGWEIVKELSNGKIVLKKGVV